MSILTHKMKTARKDYLGANCKVFFPFNEGSGTDITDIASGGVITAAPTFTVPHAVTVGVSDTTFVLTSKPANKHLISFVIAKVNTSPAFCEFRSSSTSDGFSIASTAAIKKSGVTHAVTYSSVSTTSVSCRAFTADTQTGELRLFYGDTATPISFDVSGTNAQAAGALSLDNGFVVGNAAFPSDFYLGAVFYTDTLPTDSDMETMLQWTFDKARLGDKIVHPDFALY